MPYVNIKITDEGVTKEQKHQLIQGATQLLVDVLGKSPATTIVVIEEVNTDNWGIGFDQVTELRRTNDGLWNLDLETDEVYFSPRWKSMLGYAEHELDNNLGTWESLIYADDKDAALKKFGTI